MREREEAYEQLSWSKEAMIKKSGDLIFGDAIHWILQVSERALESEEILFECENGTALLSLFQIPHTMGYNIFLSLQWLPLFIRYIYIYMGSTVQVIVSYTLLHIL